MSTGSRFASPSPSSTSMPRRLQVEVGLVDRPCRLVVPVVGLRLGDLAPAAHLREVPDRVRVVRIGRVVAEEDVEVGRRRACRPCSKSNVPVIELRDHRSRRRRHSPTARGSRPPRRRFALSFGVEPHRGADQRLGERRAWCSGSSRRTPRSGRTPSPGCPAQIS